MVPPGPLRVERREDVAGAQEPRCLVQGYVLAELHAQLPSLLGEAGEGRRSALQERSAVSGWTWKVASSFVMRLRWSPTSRHSCRRTAAAMRRRCESRRCSAWREHGSRPLLGPVSTRGAPETEGCRQEGRAFRV